MDNFNTLPVNQDLVRVLTDIYGFTEPTAAQKEAAEPFIKGENILLQAQTGSGKTFAYLLPLDSLIDPAKKELQGIILAPTHELAVQISRTNEELCQKAQLPIKTICLIGEANINKQIERLKDKPQLAVGTPGRILDLFKKRKLNGQTIKILLLDEIDELVDNTNRQSVEEIFKAVRRDRQVGAFSASVSANSKEFLQKWAAPLKEINLSSQNILNPNIKHYYLVAPAREKADVLRSLIHALDEEKILVFAQNGRNIELLADKLAYHKLKAQALHSTLSKDDRKAALEGFRKGKLQVLIASDLAARGLDIENIGCVINLDFPQSANEYVHRAGRTGRMDNSGICISIVASQEVAPLRIYKREFNLEMEEIHLYGGKIYPGPPKGKRPSKNGAKEKNPPQNTAKKAKKN